MVTTSAAWTSHYQYHHDRLVSELLVSENRANQGGNTIAVQYEYRYDDQGHLDTIEYIPLDPTRHTKTGASSIVYRRPRSGESISELTRKIQLALEEVIPRMLSAARIPDEVYCLLLVYDAENDLLPPMLALGRNADREVAVAKHGTDAKVDLWNPADFRYFNIPELRIETEDVVGPCRLMNQQLAMKGQCAPAKHLLNRVAATLMQRDWKGVLNTTGDFIVAAVDLESQDDLDRNIKKSVPAKMIQNLKRHGFI